MGWLLIFVFKFVSQRKGRGADIHDHGLATNPDHMPNHP